MKVERAVEKKTVVVRKKTKAIKSRKQDVSQLTDYLLSSLL